MTPAVLAAESPPTPEVDPGDSRRGAVRSKRFQTPFSTEYVLYSTVQSCIRRLSYREASRFQKTGKSIVQPETSVRFQYLTVQYDDDDDRADTVSRYIIR
jgi:hypothetical protein